MLFGQSILTANGTTDTYSLIDSVLAPGQDAIENPDCSHPAFGAHITQAFDSDLAKSVFVFHIHVVPDNDRCSAFDRQRNEIKTYGPSPDYLKGFLGDSVTFRWKFKLDAGFQPSSSFTHIHQIKAGDGDDSAPIITITPRAGNPQQLQLILVNSLGKTTTLARPDLAPFKGVWVEAYEKITYGFNGTYSLQIRRASDQAVLFSYSNNDIDLWRKGTTFVRPKWGIYRSLNHPEQLRDEQVRFDRLCLAKGTDHCPSEPRDGLQSVLTDMNTFQASVADHQVGTKLDAAIAHLTKASDGSFWTDRSHLQPGNGGAVLNEDKDAENQLRILLQGPTSSGADSVPAFIDRIVQADRLLVSIAITDAEAAGADSNAIARANDELAKGDDDISESNFESGLEHYRNAWQQLQPTGVQ